MNKLLSTLFIVVLLLSACGSKDEVNGDDLWEYRSDDLGNNTKVINIMENAGAMDLGKYTLALQTNNKPYGLTVKYSELNGKFDEKAFQKVGAIALGLIKDAEYIKFETPNKNVKYTVKSLDKTYNMKIKDLGQNKQRLTEFLKK